MNATKATNHGETKMTMTTKPTAIGSLTFVPALKHGDVLAIDSGRGYDRYYKIGDVWSYAAQDGRDPQESYERCVRNGHATIWVNAEGCVLDNSGMGPLDRYAAKGTTVWTAKFGDKVRICGKTFTLRPDHNDNVKLVEVAAATMAGLSDAGINF